MSVFEIVRGVEGDCLVLDGTRICGSKPWGGGRIIKTFHTDGIYEVIDKDEYHKLQAENARLRELVVALAACASVDDCDKCPINGAEYKANEIGCCYAARQRMRELGIEVEV